MSDEYFMGLALHYAQLSYSLGEVPVGAVIVLNNEVISFGYNNKELKNNPLGHAEINAIDEAAKKLGRWRLQDCTIYSTLEPCIMCAGALVHARIRRLVYGGLDPKFGAIESLYAFSKDSRLNHRFESLGGVKNDESVALLKRFFTDLREVSSPIKSPIV